MDAFGTQHIVTIDSAVDPNRIDIELLNPEWKQHIQPFHHLRYTVETGRSIRFHAVMQLYVDVADIRTRVRFGVVRELAPKILLGNAFNSRYIKTIAPKAGLVRLTASRPMLILAIETTA